MDVNSSENYPRESTDQPLGDDSNGAEDNFPEDSQPERVNSSSRRTQTQTRPTGHTNVTQHTTHQAINMAQRRTHKTNDAKPEDLTDGGDADVGQVASNAANKFEDDAERHYEHKAEASFAKGENAVFEQGDKVYGCMESAIARWWNNLVNGRKEEKPDNNNHAGAQPTAVAARA